LIFLKTNMNQWMFVVNMTMTLFGWQAAMWILYYFVKDSLELENTQRYVSFEYEKKE
jgi:hypothetical protein